jgi:hypothetical protein
MIGNLRALWPATSRHRIRSQFRMRKNVAECVLDRE